MCFSRSVLCRHTSITLGAIVLLSSTIAAQAVADEAPTLRELLDRDSERRKRSPVNAAKSFAAAHERAEDRYTIENEDGGESVVVRKRVLHVTWFRGPASTAFLYTVHDSGRVFDVREVYNFASQASRSRTLSTEQLTRLRALVRALPRSRAEPPIHRTVLVSLRDGEEWRTETYDTADLPDEFEAVMKVVGERFETRDRLKE